MARLSHFCNICCYDGYDDPVYLGYVDSPGSTEPIAMRGKFDAKKPGAARTAVFEAFVRHQIPLRRFIARLMCNASDVDDIAQEAFLRAFSVEQDRPIEQPKSFLFRIAKHIALTQLTQKSRRITDCIEDFCGLEVIPAEGSAEDELIAT